MEENIFTVQKFLGFFKKFAILILKNASPVVLSQGMLLLKSMTVVLQPKKKFFFFLLLYLK